MHSAALNKDSSACLIQSKHSFICTYTRPYLFPLTLALINGASHTRVLSGAVRFHPRRHPGGLSVRRDRHPHERVCGRLQGAAASGLAEQLLAAAGGVSGQIFAGRRYRGRESRHYSVQTCSFMTLDT